MNDQKMRYVGQATGVGVGALAGGSIAQSTELTVEEAKKALTTELKKLNVLAEQALESAGLEVGAFRAQILSDKAHEFSVATHQLQRAAYNAAKK